MISRYADLPDVLIEQKNIPPGLLPLQKLAKKWSLTDPDDVSLVANHENPESVTEFLRLFNSKQSEIEIFINSDKEGIPAKDEVVIFDLAYSSYDILLSTEAYKDIFKT